VPEKYAVKLGRNIVPKECADVKNGTKKWAENLLKDCADKLYRRNVQKKSTEK